jgi:hypothetical protein
MSMNASSGSRDAPPASGALVQDIMLRGATSELWPYGTLALIGGVTLFIAWLGLRRGMARA